MFCLVYVSAAGTWCTERALREMLVQCRRSNAQAGFTGMLHYKDGNFMQTLEGEVGAVHALQARITADRRHHGLVVLHTSHIRTRQFPDWSMGFTDLGLPADQLPVGYTEFLDTALVGPAFLPKPRRCMDLMRVFRQMN